MVIVMLRGLVAVKVIWGGRHDIRYEHNSIIRAAWMRSDL